MDPATIDAITKKHGDETSALIQILLDIQSKYNWLPPEALRRVGEKLGVPMARIQHIATFYKAFSMTPKGRHHVHVCMGTACHVRGAARVLETAQAATGIAPGETDSEMKFSLETVNCVGCCALGPVMDVNGRIHGKLSTTEATDILERCE